MKRIILPADPRANFLAHQDEIDQAIARVLRSGSYILGPEVAGFEKEFAAYIGVAEAIGVASGTDALEIALRACGCGPGDAVITVSHTAVATVAAIERAGLTPVLVDIDPQTFTMDPNHLEDAIKVHHWGRRSTGDCRVKAVIPVHLYGCPAGMPAILESAQRHDLFLIEDCAQSHGAAIQGRKTGTWGQLAAFSFYPTKNLGALGDGGAVVTNGPDVAEKVRSLREYGWRDRYISEFTGINSRLDEIQAAILRVKLKHVDKENARRRELARIYDNMLAKTDLVLPLKGDGDHVYHQYVVRTKYRQDLREFLKANSVETLVHYPTPIHLQPAYRGRVVIGKGGLQCTEQVSREVISLPLHPQMTDEQAEHVCELIAQWRAKGS